MEDPSVETHFAQRLASNEKKIRDKAVRRLRRFLHLRSIAKKDFNEDEMLRLWKGLFYCMWMSDKPLIQEELSNTISSLVFSFDDSDDNTFLFVETFFKTMAREWYGIDQLRMDKFLMFIRGILTAALEYIKKREWETCSVEKFLAVCQAVPANFKETNKSVPLSFQLHLCDIYLEELAKIAEQQISPDTANLFLQPYCQLLAKTDNPKLLKNVVHHIFEYVIKMSDIAPKLKDQTFKKLKFNYDALSERLMELTSLQEVRKQNRHEGYILVRRFQELSKGKYPLKVKFGSEGEPLTKNEFDDKIDALINEFEKEKEESKRWRKKRQHVSDDDEDEDEFQVVKKYRRALNSSEKGKDFVYKKPRHFRKKFPKRNKFVEKKKALKNKKRFNSKRRRN